MMKFHILTLFPEMVQQGLATSILGRAAEKDLISIIADRNIIRHDLFQNSLINSLIMSAEQYQFLFPGQFSCGGEKCTDLSAGDRQCHAECGG